jgi:predicted TIM-barrel fold metal-dependent hydrolase
MSDTKIFSADSHVSEPADLWVERIDKAFQFRAPRMETRERAGKLEDFFIYEGFPPHPVAVGLGAAARAGAAADGESNFSFRDQRKGYRDARPGGWNPAERLKDQDVDGVVGELLHTTLAFRLYWMEDAALQRACFRTYNDWLAEFCSHSPNRLIGVPLLSLYDIDEGVAELKRANKMGLRGAMIWLSPPASCPPYTSKVYDPLWATAQELDTPIVLHEITGGSFESRLSPSAYWREDFSLSNLVRPHEIQRTLGQLILSGVLERFPRLKIISAENGTDWLPYYVARVERTAKGPFSYPTKLSLTPLEYFQRQVYFTYINEPHAVGYRNLLGKENLMFATDYPHSASSWPDSQKIVERDTSDMPLEERRRLIYDNVTKVFNISTPVYA